jgi:hypothetical protein
MATAKTGSFYLTETVTMPGTSASGSRFTGTVDLGAYVNVATGQAIAIESVDFVYQVGADFGTDVRSMLAGNGAVSVQLVDLKPTASLLTQLTFTLTTTAPLHSLNHSWWSMILCT